MSRLFSVATLVAASVSLTLPLPAPAHAAGHQHAGTRGHPPSRPHRHSSRGVHLHCSVRVKSKGKAAKHPATADRSQHCAASSKLLSQEARTQHASDDLAQLSPHAVGDIFGVGSFVTQRSWTISPLIVARARALGTKWVREEFTASRLHANTSGRYWWTDYDRIVNQERKAGLQILGLLDYSNTWTFRDHGTMPHADMRRLASDFARYSYDVVRHFRGRVRYWEIWNEPNVNEFWHPSPDAADYAVLLNAAGNAVKRADRRSQIVLAGMSGIDLRFIRAVAAHTRRFDVVAVHPYRNLPETSFLQQVKALRILHKPIWFSEIGWPAGEGCDRCYGEVEQARYLVRFYTLAAAAGIQRVFWYDLRDDPHAASNPEAHFGLLRRDLSAKPAFVAYAYLSRLLDGSRYVGADWFGRHGLYTLRFQRGAANIAVLWNASNKNRTLTVRWNRPDADFIDSEGNVLAELSRNDGHVTVIAPQGGEPFYLVDHLPAYHVPSLGALLHFAPPPAPTPRPTARPGRPHPTPVANKAAWVAASRRPKGAKRSSVSSHHERSATASKPRLILTGTPALPVLTAPPTP